MRIRRNSQSRLQTRWIPAGAIFGLLTGMFTSPVGIEAAITLSSPVAVAAHLGAVSRTLPDSVTRHTIELAGPEQARAPRPLGPAAPIPTVPSALRTEDMRHRSGTGAGSTISVTAGAGPAMIGGPLSNAPGEYSVKPPTTDPAGPPTRSDQTTSEASPTSRPPDQPGPRPPLDTPTPTTAAETPPPSPSPTPVAPPTATAPSTSTTNPPDLGAANLPTLCADPVAQGKIAGTNLALVAADPKQQWPVVVSFSQRDSILEEASRKETAPPVDGATLGDLEDDLGRGDFLGGEVTQLGPGRLSAHLSLHGACRLASLPAVQQITFQPAR